MTDDIAEAAYSSAPGWSGAATDTVNRLFDARLAQSPDRDFLEIGRAHV